MLRELNPPQEINVTHPVPDVDTLVDIYRQQRVDKVHVRDEHYSTKITENIPGSLCVRNNHDQVMSLVGEINRLRDKFADAVKAITHYQDSRSEILHQVYPWLVTLQVSVISGSLLSTIRFWEVHLANPCHSYNLPGWKRLSTAYAGR
ncbi:DNA replication terminus site-binding protein [Klebsiella pneumoniae subsp. pneumoniae]|nr:DNA replication terminus site-binding protein [Klebsiella pneumoniae subsp. pneumoniae]